MDNQRIDAIIALQEQRLQSIEAMSGTLGGMINIESTERLKGLLVDNVKALRELQELQKLPKREE